MKTFLGLLMFFSTAVSFATSIYIKTSTHTYNRWPDHIQSITYKHQIELDQYLGEELECRLVRLTFNNLESPTYFSKGEYNLILSAECNKTFNDFKLDINYGYARGEPFVLQLSYVMNGQTYLKSIGSFPKDI